MGDTSTTEQDEYFGTARRVLRWTAMTDREVPDALGRAPVELAGRGTGNVAHLTGGDADEGFSTRVEE